MDISCPMCDLDVEHLLHVFFDCPFARLCWHYAGCDYDMSNVEFAPDWLIQKLASANNDEMMTICRVLWGIWFFRNKKVWENKVVNHFTAMDWSLKCFSDWRAAKASRATVQSANSSSVPRNNHKWQAPEAGGFKLNVDASFYAGSESFSIGMVIRDHTGSFLGGQVARYPNVNTVFEAEAMAIAEALSWLMTLPYQGVIVESDSLLSVQAIRCCHVNSLEVGHVLDRCHSLLCSRPDLSVSFVKRQSNKLAHEMACIPCLLHCHNLFTSPPASLVETILYDSTF